MSTLWDWLLSSWIYGFTHGAWCGSTFHLKGHTMIVALGGAFLSICKWVNLEMSLFLCELKGDRKRWLRDVD